MTSKAWPVACTWTTAPRITPHTNTNPKRPNHAPSCLTALTTLTPVQLPTEVDVESMVRRTQLDHSHPHHPSNADHTGQAIGGASGAGAVSGKVAGPPEASAASSKFDVLKDRNASFANYLKGR